MKRRANGTVRVLTRCARCNHQPDLYDVDRLTVVLAGRRHELVVCRSCTKLLAGEATHLEKSAIGCDPANPIDDAEFAEIFHADAARVRRTAEHFLGAEAYAWLLPSCREEVEKNRVWRESRAWRPDDGDEDWDAPDPGERNDDEWDA